MNPPDHHIDIVALGEPMIEFNQTVPGQPGYLQGYGGDTSNMIVAAARQGASCAYATRVGADEFGRMFMALWRGEGIDVSGVGIDDAAHTAVYFVTHGADGHVFSYLRAGSAASRMRPEHVPESLLRRARYLHVSGISQALSDTCAETVRHAMAVAQHAGARISYDPNLRLRLWPLERARKEIAAATAHADYFLPSLDDARALSGLSDPDAILDWAFSLGAGAVLLKLGCDGVIVSDGTQRRHIEGHEVVVVDATGAGDCFDGALVARLAAGDDVWEAARYANAAAALAIGGFGAVAPLPRAAAVWELLNRD